MCVGQISKFLPTAMSVTNLATAAAIFIAMTSCTASCERQSVRVKYYSSRVLRCSANGTQPENARIFWIPPDAVAIDHTTPQSQLPSALSFVHNNSSSELNITRVDDDQFGYYTCVAIDNNTGEVTVTQWGVNIEGADFSELEDQYRHSAIVGAIAAAVMLVVVGGGCIIWHFRYSSRDPAQRQGKEGLEERSPDENKGHSNQGFPVTDDVEVELKPGEFGNGTASATDTPDGNLVAEETRDHKM